MWFEFFLNANIFNISHLNNLININTRKNKLAQTKSTCKIIECIKSDSRSSPIQWSKKFEKKGHILQLKCENAPNSLWYVKWIWNVHFMCDKKANNGIRHIHGLWTEFMLHGFRTIECWKWHIWDYKSISQLKGGMHWMPEDFCFLMVSIFLVCLSDDMDEMCPFVFLFVCEYPHTQMITKNQSHKTRCYLDVNFFMKRNRNVCTSLSVCAHRHRFAYVLNGIPWHAEPLLSRNSWLVEMDSKHVENSAFMVAIFMICGNYLCAKGIM